MKYIFKHQLFLVFTFFLITGCAPGLEKSLEITYLPSMEDSTDDQLKKDMSSLKGIALQLDSFTDERASKDSITIGQRKVLVEGSIPILVKDNFREFLSLHGMTNCYRDCIKISVAVKNWDMQIDSDFPASSAKASAVLEITVTDLDNKQYTGNYSGKSTIKHPILTEELLIKTYGQAINEAIIAFFSDRKIKELVFLR